MSESFLPFHSFADSAIAEEFAAILGEAGIKFQIEKEPTILGREWIGSSSDPDIIIKISPDDFEAAHLCLQNYFDSHVNEIGKDYFLFSFTNEELSDILRKPDEWGDLNYRLAQKLLAERGLKTDIATVQKMRKERIEELAKPDKTDWSGIRVGYLFLAAGLFLLLVTEVGFVYSPFCFIIGLFIGRHLAYNKKILPDGSRVLAYNDESRKHGKIIIATSFVLLCITIITWLSFEWEYI